MVSLLYLWGFPGGSVVKNSPVSAGDVDSIPGLGRSPGGGNGNPLQYSCLDNLMDRGAWWATVHGVAKSWMKIESMCAHVRMCMCAHTHTHTHNSFIPNNYKT